MVLLERRAQQTQLLHLDAQRVAADIELFCEGCVVGQPVTHPDVTGFYHLSDFIYDRVG